MKKVPALALLALCIAGPALAAEAEPKVDIANEGGIRDKWMLADGAKLAAPAFAKPFQKPSTGSSSAVSLFHCFSTR